MPDDLLLGAGYKYGTSKREAAELLIQLAETTAQNATPEITTYMETNANQIRQFLNGQAENVEWTRRFISFGKTIGVEFSDRWTLQLIINGRRLDDQLDILLSEIIVVDFRR